MSASRGVTSSSLRAANRPELRRDGATCDKGTCSWTSNGDYRAWLRPAAHLGRKPALCVMNGGPAAAKQRPAARGHLKTNGKNWNKKHRKTRSRTDRTNRTAPQKNGPDGLPPCSAQTKTLTFMKSCRNIRPKIKNVWLPDSNLNLHFCICLYSGCKFRL